MRTKRKTYDYSSDGGYEDYDGEDYDDDDFEDEDPQDASEGDSDYGGGPAKATGGRHASLDQKRKLNRNTEEYEMDEEVSLEDEDPFSPEIEQILADK